MRHMDDLMIFNPGEVLQTNSGRSHAHQQLFAYLSKLLGGIRQRYS